MHHLNRSQILTYLRILLNIEAHVLNVAL